MKIILYETIRLLENMVNDPDRDMDPIDRLTIESAINWLRETEKGPDKKILKEGVTLDHVKRKIAQKFVDEGIKFIFPGEIGEKVYCKDFQDLLAKATTLSREGYGMIISLRSIPDYVLIITALPEKK